MSEHKDPYETENPKCKGCIYAGAQMCEYILITGKSPKSQGAHIDPDGDGGCELYDNGKKKRARPKTICIKRDRNSKLDTPEVWALYKSGKSDSEIAEAAGVAILTVFNWRKKNGLPSKQRMGNTEMATTFQVFLSSSGELIASGTARECASQMRYSNAKQIYQLYKRCQEGRSRKYEMVKHEGSNGDG